MEHFLTSFAGFQGHDLLEIYILDGDFSIGRGEAFID